MLLSLRSFPNASHLRFNIVRQSSGTNLSKLHSTTIKMEGADDKPRNERAESVSKIRELVNSDPKDGWNKCWEQALTPWDLGQPTPVILHLLETGSIPKGRILVPGCGSGHDVVAIAGPERHVVGLDFSENAVRKARELFSSSTNANHYDFIKEDFFAWNSPRPFDLIFDYTFFCAIEPSMRPAWARQVSSLLKPDGELITLMFPIDDHVGGPPYKVSLADYEEVLHPMGFQAISMTDNELAIGTRKGREKLGRWKKSLKESHL